MVGIVVPLGSVEPFVPVSEIPVIKGDTVIVKKVRCPSTTRPCQCCFGHNCITFNEIHSGIYQRHKDVPHLPEHISERPLSPGHSELHLGHVARLMDCKHSGPWHRVHVVCGRQGEEVHPLRSPCHRAVGTVVCVQDHRHEPAVTFSCHITGRAGHGNLELFKFSGIDMGQRIALGGIYDPVTVRVYVVPSQLSRIIAGHIELCRGNDGENKESKYEYELLEFHFKYAIAVANLIFFYIFATYSPDLLSSQTNF